MEGIDAGDQALMAENATLQPWASFTQPLRLQRFGEAPFARVAIACNDMRAIAAAGAPPIVAMTQPPWRYLELETGHWPMFPAPASLTRMLADLAQN